MPLSEQAKQEDRKGKRYKLWGGLKFPLKEGYFNREKPEVEGLISQWMYKHYGKGMY